MDRYLANVMSGVYFKQTHTEAEDNHCVFGLQKCHLAINPVHHILEQQVNN
jgi:hypothetical protein